ncbi:hypothetical protein M9Y10_038427 [Tritrichomonas musculus]|uniref:Uncharacterized protein n=1 Tax=Tritrichomonas musculus TaxID=1915356 RepID=A0ABR2KA73_9EUKA
MDGKMLNNLKNIPETESLSFTFSSKNEFDSDTFFDISDDKCFDYSDEQPSNELGIQLSKISNNIIEKPKKIKQGLGNETEKMKGNRYYRVPYNKCAVYPLLKKYKRVGLIKLGSNYDEYFKDEINSNLLPRFGRIQKRNKGIAIWFFENIKNSIFEWLISETKKEA